jgi:hypothetical protein
MCRCGQTQPGIPRIEPAARGHAARTPRTVVTPTVRYEYTGDTGLTVFGGATRTRYRFAHPGAQVAVDARDAASLESVPRLRRVSIEGVPRG